MSFDTLQEKIIALGNPTVAGLDPKPEYVPPHMLEACYREYGSTLEGAAEAIYRFNCGLMDALKGLVPAVKPQAAYYERLGWRGMEVLERTIRYAREAGFFVIADIKRGDIGSTAEAYSDAWLGKTQVGEARIPVFQADCVTLNGYMGSDSVKPFLADCAREDKCVFVLVKTSNPGSGELQNIQAGEGTVYQRVGDLVEELGGEAVGKYGFTPCGAVTGATYPEELRDLRSRLPRTFFLVPGYGAQGGTAQDVQYAFTPEGRGAIVNASRSIMCAWKKTGQDGRDYQQAARKAAQDMREDICRYVSIR